MGKRWSKEEIEQLCMYWGTYSVPTIAKRLNRTVSAVKTKVNDLKLGRAIDNSEYIPFYSLMREFGIEAVSPSFSKKLKTLGFKVHTTKVNERSFRVISLDEFWEFTEKNRTIFDFSKLHVNALGEEPDWVREARSEAFNKNQKCKSYVRWSPEEDKELLRLVRMYSLSRSEIAKRMKRSEASIKGRLQILGIKDRPIPADNHTLWAEEDLNLLPVLIEKCENYEDIAQILNKTALAVRAKVKKLYMTENLPKARKILKKQIDSEEE